jgi:hypothetical protein
MKKLLYSLLFLVAFTKINKAQESPFALVIEQMNIPQLGGLQAYAFGTHEGKWLIFGGRLDGLHRRQPFASFDVAGNNNQLLVVDPVSQQKWSAALTSLPIDIQEQLSSTNMEFHQDGNHLYVVGGYGYHNASASKKTFDKLTVINVPATIAAIQNNSSFTGFFRQYTDAKFAVTGGHLKKINNTFYLVGGNRFDGNYNPMGNPTYTQVYTNAIRRFTVQDDGINLQITHLPEWYDANQLHRRDYNVVPQILPNGAEGITAFSGVFQVGIDLPFLNSVNIDSTAYSVNAGFQQYYNHYHCAVLPVYSSGLNQMHSVFFGGIAQYFDSAGVLVQDNNVPFVKTIARVTRTADGKMAEYKLPIEMPGLMGAGSEFIFASGVPIFKNEILNLDAITADTTLVGYIYGGINSTLPNIFFINTGAESTAGSQILKVKLIKKSTVGKDELNVQSRGTLQMQVFPNPNDGRFNLYFNLVKSSDVSIIITGMDGKVLEEKNLKNLAVGKHSFEKKIRSMANGGSYFVSIITSYESATQKVMIEP